MQHSPIARARRVELAQQSQPCDEREAPSVPRDPCGLRHRMTCESWPFLIRLLLWATRNNRR